MNALSELIGSTSGLMENRLVLLSIVGIAGALFALGAAMILTWATDPVRRKLGVLGSEAAPATSWGARVQDLVSPLSRFLLPTDTKERGSIEQKLSQAGFRSASALSVFYAIKTVGALVLVMAWFSISGMFAQLTTGQVLFYAVVATFIGLVLPNLVLRRLLERRQKALRNAFPDALDMLIVCVESGLGLTAAIQRVSDELSVSHAELATELAQVGAETRAGLERETALRNLAERTGLEDIRGLVGLLVQTLRFGTSVADSLRVYSDEFRDKRMQKAEELAAKIGTKLIFPLVLCFFPGFFVVAVGPAVLKLVEVFSSANFPQ